GKSLKFFVSGGAPLSPFIIWWFEVLGIKVLQGYGLTEASPVVSVNTPLQNRLGSVGKPLPGIEVKIKDDLKEGEILVKGENVMLGYYKSPEETSLVLRDNWLYTGDIGTLDSHGFLFILGREKNVIVLQSGLKVYPEEIEEELLKSSLIRDVCIIGKKESGFPEEKVYALIVPNDEHLGLSLDKDSEKIRGLMEKEIKNLNERLAAYKHIRGFELRKELPKTATRKIKKELVKKTL
ncbi:MAG: AMP-binding protein, partial [Candidatus Omnitrophica bacterium]|nr:AMP-binding protein [Candidatus Omnitrophota bacterium]